MIKVAQHKLKGTSRAHIHTNNKTSTRATKNKQSTRHYQILHNFMSILTNTLHAHVFAQINVCRDKLVIHTGL